MSEASLLFEGLNVLDVGSWIAAPVATTMLADMGATVIKVEEPKMGDAYRNFANLPFTPTADVNYAWAADNRNKRAIGLNLRDPQGLAILKQLIAQCDVYVTNQPLPLRRELGLMYEDLRADNQSMIYASITAYGEEGPERDREGFDLVAYWARAGLMDMVRPVGGEPAQALPGMGDHPTAVALYANIVTALLRKERTGKGARVHTSLLANGLFAGTCISQAMFADADFSSYRHPQFAHFNRALYQTADDGWLQFTMVRSPEEFDRLVIAMERFDLLADERFTSPDARFENYSALVAEIRTAVIQKTVEQWVQIFAEANVPASVMGQMTRIADDPQIALNQMTRPPAEDIGLDRVIQDPINVEGVARVGAKKAPELGEHTDAVLAELGYSPEQIQQLHSAGVV